MVKNEGLKISSSLCFQGDSQFCIPVFYYSVSKKNIYFPHPHKEIKLITHRNEGLEPCSPFHRLTESQTRRVLGGHLNLSTHFANGEAGPLIRPGCVKVICQLAAEQGQQLGSFPSSCLPSCSSGRNSRQSQEFIIAQRQTSSPAFAIVHNTTAETVRQRQTQSSWPKSCLLVRALIFLPPGAITYLIQRCWTVGVYEGKDRPLPGVWGSRQRSRVGSNVQCMCGQSRQSCLPLQPHGLQHARLLCPWDSAAKNTGVGCRFLLQQIVPSQGSNPHLLQLRHFRWIPYQWAAGEGR